MKRILTALALVTFIPSAVPAADGTVEVTVNVEVKGLTSVDLYLGLKEGRAEGTPPAYLFEGVPPGRYALTAEASTREGRRYLGVTDVKLKSGEQLKAEVDLKVLRDLEGFCRECHPDPGEKAGPAQIPRDVHASGRLGGGKSIDCEDCHTPHRRTDRPAYAVASFDGEGALCRKCHDLGHSGTSNPEGCLNCHAIRASEVEKGTSYISAASRTLPQMKILGGNKVPEVFGCTYCHSNTLNEERMRGVLTDFGALTSKHPVGYDFTKNADTFNEYMSGLSSATPGEMDCVDCHDPLVLVDQSPENLSGKAPYANHSDPSGALRKSNPFMLKKADRDDFCRLCHGKEGTYSKGETSLKAHDDSLLTEGDGTPLRTSECSACHNVHSSSKPKLFRDGSEGGRKIAVGVGNRCAEFCHYRGDKWGGYDRSGHGKAAADSGRTMGFGCSSCHSVNDRHEGTQPKLLNFKEDEKTSRYGTSLTSVCYICHREYEPHPGNVGCLDCHDEHGESREKTSNTAMIPGALPNGHESTRKVVFSEKSKEGYNYFRKDGAGLCDNEVCHGEGQTPSGTPFIPLAGLMKEGRHSGGDQKAGSDCGTCHSHHALMGAGEGNTGGGSFFHQRKR